MKNGVRPHFLAAALALCCGAVAAHDEHGYAQNLKLIRPMAEQGNALAQYNLGVMYASGQGVKQDCREAAKWYRLAAAQGNAMAQHKLGLLYSRPDCRSTKTRARVRDPELQGLRLK